MYVHIDVDSLVEAANWSNGQARLEAEAWAQTDEAEEARVAQAAYLGVRPEHLSWDVSPAFCGDYSYWGWNVVLCYDGEDTVKAGYKIWKKFYGAWVSGHRKSAAVKLNEKWIKLSGYRLDMDSLTITDVI